MGTKNPQISPVLVQVKQSLPWTDRQRLRSLCKDVKRVVFPLSSFDLINNSGNMTTLQPCERILTDLPSTQTMLSLFWIYYCLYDTQLSASVVTANERWFQLPPLQNLPKGGMEFPLMEEETSTRRSLAATDFTAGWWLGCYSTVTQFLHV